MQYYVYILTNKNHTVLYTGVTRDLVRRVYEHKNHVDPNSFTAKYNIQKLIYFEETNDVRVALEREKQIKSWPRSRKIALIFKKSGLVRSVSLHSEMKDFSGRLPRPSASQ